MLGLFAFTYGGLHFLNYMILDQALSFAAIIEDITERPFITIGLLAILLMTPLAITSTSRWQKRLGRNWIKLHRLTYLASILLCWHFFWQVKKDLTEPLIYCFIIAVLLGMRALRIRHR